MDEQEWLYRKVGRRYHAVKLFTGFPADGVWFAQTKPGVKAQTHILKIGELPDPMPVASMQHHADLMVRVLHECKSAGLSNYETVRAMLKAIAAEMQEGAKRKRGGP